ncbi:MAG: 4Fe-4S binding protein, partial [Campylobacter sp.]|nr:4Fe-4S binding protein [Campylobacter sp.]
CAKACPFEAITIENNVAYIDYNKCRLCRKCVLECPTGLVKSSTNFKIPPAIRAMLKFIKAFIVNSCHFFI